MRKRTSESTSLSTFGSRGHIGEAPWLGVWGPSEGCFNALCPEKPEGQVLGTDKGWEQGAAGEAEMKDAGEKGFILLVTCI